MWRGKRIVVGMFGWNRLDCCRGPGCQRAILVGWRMRDRMRGLCRRGDWSGTGERLDGKVA